MNGINRSSQPNLYISTEEPKLVKGIYDYAILVAFHVTNIGQKEVNFEPKVASTAKVLNAQMLSHALRPGEQVTLRYIVERKPIIDFSLEIVSKEEGTIEYSSSTVIDSSAISQSASFDPVLSLDPTMAQYLIMRFHDTYQLGKLTTAVQDMLDIKYDKTHPDEVIPQLHKMQDILGRMGYFYPPVDIETVPDFLIYVQRIMEFPQSINTNTRINKPNKPNQLGGKEPYGTTNQPIRSYARN